MVVNKSQRILVVDDTPADALLLVRMLTERGFVVRAVNSGKLALEAATAELPDLILLDISMPEMNGYEVCQRLKAEPKLKGVPIIFLSALNQTFDRVKAFSLGGADFVTKPFELEEALARIQTQLGLSRSRIS
jgi:DNA-binding response OmpR family regulator